ncbi:hypothetical protein Poli38472_009012 [Pythium oligandrum]|uniref:HIT domain-containing protein n=1 Tax=Pythium oligandrum TaxID=41045 RepID=A0A8K1FIC7_PYTOL|nr:hypothetical protein Poli38472_009012 [Pythium oligandrum]|eukprot:TMW64845.1 hypothetical protein Poli38472_009012 [Pythium oligandrum]
MSKTEPHIDFDDAPTDDHGTRAHRSLRLHVGVFSKHKGVRYDADGRVRVCRFCEILRHRDETFLYEEDALVVFRPLHPIAPSHILIVPRAHIRNVKKLTVDHIDLLRRMRIVAEKVLQNHSELSSPSPPTSKDDTHSMETTADDDDVLPYSPMADQGVVGASSNDCRFAFHVPPFNSIDHVHMHAFRGSTGYFGRIKYRTESWWCRSFDEVMTRLEQQIVPEVTHASTAVIHARPVSTRSR